MLTFEKVTGENAEVLRRYYQRCAYRLCEYSVGVKLMWQDYLHPSFTETAGCLIVRNEIRGETVFDLPVPGEDGDLDAALTAIEDYCTERGIRPVLSAVPEEYSAMLCRRYTRLTLTNERVWKDYLYHAEDLASFAGRGYSGQRNHIKQFRRAYPDAAFVELTAADGALIERFWADYEAEFHKENIRAQEELGFAKGLVPMLESGWFRCGGLVTGGRLAALCISERCGETLVTHVEKALYSHPGAYPAIVQAFAAHYGADCAWINREDDARDKGLRTSKLQYRPADLGAKMHFAVGCELDDWDAVPRLETERLVLDELTEADIPAYNALCLDDERNRWWGYDYRQDLHGARTEDYFLTVAHEDFAKRLAVNFAVRLDGALIGEAVLYRFDWKGGAELGCRIAPEYAGHGYGTEAFAAAADWALYRLGLDRVTAKCYKENTPSYRMLSSCMRPSGEDGTFYYFLKKV
ncbi:MAG: GNAT family N-acetyltransferase [Oscillospiraceae bacterium]|nr:GNAT family N-acetyltransferase [Oscillospiraceae bacterium]